MQSSPRPALLTVAAVLALGCATSPSPAEPAASAATSRVEVVPFASPEEALAAGLNGDHRKKGNAARNAHRHPAETLAFFGLQPNMTVVELWPGGGWYSEVLGPVLRDQGTLVLANFDPGGKNGRGARNLLARAQKRPDMFGTPLTAVLDPPSHTRLGGAGSADMVVTFRSSHNWTSRGVLEPVFAGAFEVLKPGGVFGVVQHRAPEGADPKISAKSGYVPEAHIIATAEKVGFELDARSEINANPKDTKDHPKGVWTLPPTLNMGDEQRDHWLSIGESDRMTLRFVKPGGAAPAAPDPASAQPAAEPAPPAAQGPTAAGAPQAP